MQMERNLRGEVLITTLFLSTLDKTQLIDLLQHKTRLLLSASNAHLADHYYIETIRQEVEKIQAEIKKR